MTAKKRIQADTKKPVCFNAGSKGSGWLSVLLIHVDYELINYKTVQ